MVRRPGFKTVAIIAAVLILSSFHFPAFTRTQKFITDLYGSYLKGLMYAQDGNFSKALSELRRAKRLDPTSVAIRLKITNILIRLGELDAAERELKEAKKVDPESFDASLALIFLYSYTRNDEMLELEYQEFLEKAHRSKPEDVRIAEYLGQFYFYKKRPADALEVYEGIVKSNPSHVDGVFWLGYLYEETGKRKEAISMWKKALKIDPTHALTLNSLGYIYAEQGIKLNEAEEMIKKALEKEPENGAFLDSLGWVYYKKRDYKKAEAYLTKAIAQHKDPVIYEHLGDLYLKLNRLEEVIRYYKEGLEYFPDYTILKEKLSKYGKTDQKSQEKSQ